MNRKDPPSRSVMALSLLRVSAAQAWDAELPGEPGQVSANAWQPSLLTAFGTFTYADTALPSPFSRYLEDGLKRP